MAAAGAGTTGGVRVREPRDMRRIALMVGLLFLTNALANVIAAETYGQLFEHPDVYSWVAPVLVVAGLVCLLPSLALSDDVLTRIYPPGVIVLFPIAVASTLVFMWSVGYPTSSFQTITYAIIAIAAFVLLGRWLAVVMVTALAIGHGFLELTSPTVWPAGLMATYVAAVLLVAGSVMGWLMERLEQARDKELTAALELADLNSGLEQRIAEQMLEVRESRARIVAASDESQRRIERNIHDGAQQQLVAISLDLRILAERAAELPVDVIRQELDQAHTNLKAALDDLRELARGLHPPVLTTDGLAAALQQLAGRAPLPVDVTANETRYPTPIETAAFFIAAEALANTGKHAAATRAAIEVANGDGALRLVVSDDGSGGAVVTPYGGLGGLADRVAALDGSLQLVSPPGGGTTITAVIPLSSADGLRVDPDVTP